MKKLIALMIVLIPAAAFAAKDASSSSIYPKGMEKICQGLEKDARTAAGMFLYFDNLYGEHIKNEKYDKARDAGKQSDLSLAQAAKVSTVYGALCK